MFVLATAGHVDHGKSTLLRTLTNQEPDRLPEEKRRGMTVDLNFVWLMLEGTRVGIIDVPGHQKFVRNTIAGLMNVDAYLMIVAADDGWMPQSEEHWEVLKSLGMGYGLGVITKCDLVSPERQSDVEQTVQARLLELGSATTVRFTPQDQNCKVTVINEIKGLIKRLPAPRSGGSARLWVDRAFSPKGLGTVVTGTLREGVIQVGQQLALMPSGERTTVRGIQCYHENKESAEPVTRIALQLAKVTTDQVQRGTLLVGDENTHTTMEIDAELTCFKGLSKKSKTYLALLGTAAVDCKVVPFEAIKAKARGWARLHFSIPVPLRMGDRLIIRDHGDERNIAAAMVADVTPTERLHLALPLLEKWQNTAVGQIEFLLAKRGAIDIERLSHEIRYDSAELVKTLRDRKEIPLSPRWFLARSLAATDKKMVIARLTSAYRGSAEIIRQLLPLVEAHFTPVSPSPITAEEQEAWNLAKEVLTQANSHPVNLRDQMASKAQSFLAGWVREKKIMGLGEGFYVLQTDWEQWVKKVLARVDERGAAKTGDLREFMRLSRKEVVLILEKMDSERFTYLKDGVRRRLR